MNKENLRKLKAPGGFTDIDIHFALKMEELSRVEVPDLIFIIIALACNAVLSGRNVCLELSSLGRHKDLSSYFTDLSDVLKEDFKSYSLSDDMEYIQFELLKLNVVGKADAQDEKATPLVLDDDGRLYIFRYWDYERRLAELVKRKACKHASFIDISKAAKYLNEYRDFQKGINKKFELNEWQNLAVFTALMKNFSVISGGPGTGKTTISSAIITILIKLLHSDDKPLRISVCAPTGKAAARIKEALSENMEPEIKKIFEPSASTIHRLLGYISNSPYFRFNAENKLPADVLLIDEASMIHVSLMAKLLQSVGDGCRIIMLGDKDQLASVESGAVINDICKVSDINKFTSGFVSEYAKFADSKFLKNQITARVSPLSDCSVQLMKSFRFDDSKGIGKVSRAVNLPSNTGLETALSEIMDNASDEISSLIPLPPKWELRNKLLEIFEKEKDFSDYIQESDLSSAYDKFNSFKIICAVRNGNFGVENLNRITEEIFRHKYKITDDNYRGKPLMITENDYTLKLFNGDIGLMWNEKGGDVLRAYFPNPEYVQETSSDEERFISHPVSRLPAYESVFAITVHKAQGSGFRHILLVFPDKDSPVLTKELVYTALTRAKEKVYIWTNQDIFGIAVSRATKRSSGFANMLEKDSNHSG